MFARAREAARATSCKSNLKQIATSFLMYTQDYDELMPAARINAAGGSATCNEVFNSASYSGWIGNVLQPYAKNGGVFRCPSQAAVIYNHGTATNCNADPRIFRVSYSYNYSGTGGTMSGASGNYPHPSQATAGILRPAEFAILWDSDNRWSDGNNFYARDVAQYNAKNYMYGARHSETMNIAYLDGHVKASRLDQMKLGNFVNFNDADVRRNASVTAPWP